MCEGGAEGLNEDGSREGPGVQDRPPPLPPLLLGDPLYPTDRPTSSFWAAPWDPLHYTLLDTLHSTPRR